MARVKKIEKEQASPEVREMFDSMEQKGVKIINLYRILAHSPSVMRNYLRLGTSLIAKAELPPKLRELVILRLAKLNGSEYEWTQHVPIANETGLSEEQIAMVEDWSASPVFSEEERAVLQYTDEVDRHTSVKDETFEALRAFLSERSIVELTLSIGYWGMVARLLVPLQLEIDINTLGSAEELIGRKK